MSLEVVVKIGGSLAAGGSSGGGAGGGSAAPGDALRALMTTLVDVARGQRLLVVPGGGAFADAVRAAFDTFGLSEGAAHRMALLAMDQYGLLLADIAPGAAAVTSLADARAAAGAGRLPVLLPSAAVWAADPLENSWRVTGDAIAAWVAAVAEARLLVLAKSAAVPSGPAAATTLAESGLVDPVFPRVLRTPCWVLAGRHPERLRQLLATGTTIGTEVLPCNCS